MNMLIMTAKDAKTHFGELMDNMQREPVFITKNNRPVGAFISLEDLQGTYIADLFAEPEAGHEKWVATQVLEAVEKIKTAGSKGRPMDEVHTSVMGKIQQHLANK